MLITEKIGKFALAMCVDGTAYELRLHDTEESAREDMRKQFQDAAGATDEEMIAATVPAREPMPKGMDLQEWLDADPGPGPHGEPGEIDLGRRGRLGRNHAECDGDEGEYANHSFDWRIFAV